MYSNNHSHYILEWLFRTIMSSNDTLLLKGNKPLEIESFYLDHHRWLLNWLCKKLGSTHHAEDIAHNTFLRLFSVQGLEAIKEPRGYLTTTATRLIIDDKRRKQVEQNYLENFQYYNGTDACLPSTEEVVIVTETLLSILAMFDGLPLKYQQAFLLHRLEGLNYAQISEQIGISKSSVKQYIAKVMLHCYRLAYGEDE